MNEVINKFLLAGDKVMAEIHLKQPRFTYSAKYDGYQIGLASIIYKCFDKKSASLPDKSVLGNGIANDEIKQTLQLAKKLHKPIIRKFKKRKVYSEFKDNIWGADLADIQLISKFDKRFRFLLCVIDIFSKYARVVPLKDEKSFSIVNAFQKVLDDSNRSEVKSEARKPNKIWVDKGSEFYINSFKKWLKDDDIKIYSIRKSVVAEKFIRTLKAKIYKYMTSVSKNEYIDKLHNIVDEYNNSHDRSINMKPANVKDNTYIDF